MGDEIIGFVVCGLVPLLMCLGLVALLVWLLRPKPVDTSDARLSDLERNMHWLAMEKHALEQRVLHLEGLAASALREAARPVAPGASIELATAETGPAVETAPAAEPAPAVEPAPVETASSGEPAATAEATASGAATASAAESASEAPPLAAAAAQDSPPAEIGAPREWAAARGPAPVAPVVAASSWGPPPPSSVAPGAPPPPTALPPVTAPPAASPPPPEKPAIAWEQWIGVRGAAALGASILLLAGIYFFEYSIEHGLITPAMRMVAGTLVGLGCVLAAELGLRKRYTILANWLDGAGIGILYVAFWAGHAVYHLYPDFGDGGAGTALVLMVATTAACVALALRHGSLAIAALGLFGGFITPIAISTGSDRPVALFAYLLLLDAAMLWVAYRQRWAWMALVCLGGTAIYQAGWLFGRLDEPRILIGVAVIAVFAVLFAALPSDKRPSDKRPSADGSVEEESLLWRLARSSGVVLPLLFTTGLAARTSLGDSFWPTSMLLVLLSIAASLVGLRHRSPILPSAAALAASGTLLTWAVAHRVHEAGAVWQLVGLALALLIVFVAAAELGRWRGRPSGQIPAALFTAALATLACLAAPIVGGAGPWPWLVGWVAALVAGAVLGRHPEWSRLPIAYATLVGLGLGSALATQAGEPGQPGGALYLGLALAVAIFGAALGVAGAEPARGGRDHAGGALAVTLLALLGLSRDVVVLPVWAYFGATLLLAVMLLLLAARRGGAPWMIGGLLAATFAQGLWIVRAEEVGPVELIGLAATVLLFALYPVVAPAAVRESPWAWRTAALAGPLGLLSLRHVYLEVLGAETIGLLPVLLAMLSIGAATLVRLRGPDGSDARRVAIVWLAATAAFFVTLAIPMQLENEWLTIGWALEALALTVLWRRLDHTGLKYLGLGLAGAICVRLVMNPYVLDYAGRGLPVLNWISYTYLVPAACLVAMWALLRTVEPPLRRPWEVQMLGRERDILAGLSAAGAVAVVFVWINLTILDAFTSEETLRIPTEHLPARDLSISIAWAVYALALLALGVARRSTALRIASLALILVTAGKAFLYDLSHLADLYRVASLVGLALSLIVISLAYQRFVFRTAKPEAA